MAKKQVFIGDTLFHLYVSILLSAEYRKSGQECLFILCDGDNRNEALATKVKELNVFDHVLYVPFYAIERHINKKRFKALKILLRNKLYTSQTEKRSELSQWKGFLSEAEFNVFILHRLPAAYPILQYPSNLIRILEDGDQNYTETISKWKAFKRKYILRTFIGDGLDKEVNEIHVQKPKLLPERIKVKGKELDLKGMVNTISSETKEKLSKLFPFNVEIQNNKPSFLLVTQPFSEDNFIDEPYKINTYNKLLDEFAIGYNIYIKPHPRESTDYSKVLEHQVQIIPQDFPLELIDIFTDAKFEKGLTIYSSALSNIDCVIDKIILGREYDKKLT